jgi:hypothetical protein
MLSKEWEKRKLATNTVWSLRLLLMRRHILIKPFAAVNGFFYLRLQTGYLNEITFDETGVVVKGLYFDSIAILINLS